MTEFKIPADTYLRLAKLALRPDEYHPKYQAVLQSVRIENLGGVSIAVASCGQVLAAECLLDSGEDGSVSVTIDPKLIAIAEAELSASGSLVITQAPGWTIARGSVTGTMYPLNAEIPGEWPDWRGLIPAQQPTKNNGVFVLAAEWLARLASSAPSQIIVLPRFVDMTQPVILNDRNDINWMGFILPVKTDGATPAEIPDWIR